MKCAAEKILDIIKTSSKDRVLVAIDGRCASGKTTLANELYDLTDCNIIHMDDFFLQPFQRTVKRLEEPGGNIDYERFESEILKPLKSGLSFSYRPFSCRTATLGNAVKVDCKRLTVIEGSYSCHPFFWDYYDYRFFVDAPDEVRKERILVRNGREGYEKFISTWIPMEEKYFDYYAIKEKCNCIFNGETL